jgi:hypothetical protein
VRLGCGAHGEDEQGPIPVIGEDPVTVEPRVGPEDKPEAPLRRQVERLLKNTAGELGITEEELKARALLKPKLDITEQVDRMMHRLDETRVMVCVPKRLDR